MQLSAFYKAIFATLILLVISGCRQSEEQYIFESEEILPLPNEIVVIGRPKGQAGKVVDLKPLFLLERVSPNQFGSPKGDPFIISLAQMPNREGFWIVQTPSKDGKFIYQLAKIEDDIVRMFDEQIIRSFGIKPVPKPDISSFNDLVVYFDLVLDLGLENLSETSYYYFDTMQPNANKEMLDTFVDAANLDYRERRNARALLREQKTERREDERLVQLEEERRRLLAEQNAAVQDAEKKVISFSDGTYISFCISESTIMASIQAASEQNYFAFINRLSDLRKERLCTERISMKRVEDMEVVIENLSDGTNGRIFLVASISRNSLYPCDQCDRLRSSDRLYFISYNELGGDQYGWKGYEQFVVENRTVGGILEFLLKK